ncbi:AMP-dependent synthetase and ligase [Obelidium mucronatum]|nr:AMP-dependent synthetase and ligase [Obelidium mucronatum]
MNSIANERIQAIAGHLANSSSTSRDGGRSVCRSELTPLALLERTVNLYPNQPAFVHATNNNASCSYRQFSLRIKQLAISLVAKGGIKPGEKVAVLAPNSPVILESNFGVPLAGAILVSINTRLLQDEVEYILKKSQARLLFVDKELEYLTVNWKSCGVRVRVVSADHFGLNNSIKTDPYEQFLAGAGTSAALKPFSSFPPLISENNTIAINFTSGTTGRPKGVMYHYRGAYLNSLCMALEMGMTVETNYLWVLPMFHASGWCFPWAVTAVGGCHTLLRKVDYSLIWSLLLNNGITHFCGAPTVQLSIVNHPSAKPVAKPIKTMVAAAPPSPTLLESMLKLNITPIHVYGLTETYGPSTVCAWQPEWKQLGPHDLAEKLARQGQAFLASDEVLVLDSKTGQQVPSDGKTLGEVVFRGNLVMTGYLDDEKATSEAFRGGFFHSGDVAVKHPDGYIELRDRQKDIIISGGENISTIEIENAIMSHPAILETCVVSSPDVQWGERPVAFVTLKEAKTGEEAIMFGTELLAFLRTKLAGFKMPVRVNILAELPKTSTGKIQKFVLRELEWKQTGGKKIN